MAFTKINDFFTNAAQDVVAFVEQVEQLKPVKDFRSTLPEHFQKAVTSSLESFKATLKPKITSSQGFSTGVKADHVFEDIFFRQGVRILGQTGDYLQGTSTFSFEILKKQLENSPGNTLISPMSISMLMAMDMHGVDAKTRQELAEYIHLPSDVRELKACVQTVMENMSAVGVKIANLLYLNPEYRLSNRFKEIIAQSYKGKALEGTSADEINAWVQATTNGLIKDIVSQDDLEDFFLAMANAIYFKGTWLNKFDAKDTESAIFTCPGDVKKTVDMMEQRGRFNYYEDDLCQAVELPYKDAQGMSMTLILPKNFNDFSFIDAKFFKTIRQEMAMQRNLEIKLPKFKLEDKINVKETLKAMGMHQLFEKPDFSDMVDLTHPPTAEVLPKLFIDTITQKTVLALDEEGTEAATVTVQIMRPECLIERSPAEKEIHFNRPFLSALTYQGAPVLFGAVREPKTTS